MHRANSWYATWLFRFATMMWIALLIILWSYILT